MIDAGVVGFKCFLIDSGVSEFPYVTPEALDEALVYLNGTGTVLAVNIYYYYSLVLIYTYIVIGDFLLGDSKVVHENRIYIYKTIPLLSD